MKSSNISNTQHLFSDLPLTPKKVNAAPSKVTVNYDSSIFNKSPEIYDLVRFQQAIMLKYMHTSDSHFKNIFDALTPQIEEKIRAFEIEMKCLRFRVGGALSCSTRAQLANRDEISRMFIVRVCVEISVE